MLSAPEKDSEVTYQLQRGGTNLARAGADPIPVLEDPV